MQCRAQVARVRGEGGDDFRRRLVHEDEESERVQPRRTGVVIPPRFRRDSAEIISHPSCVTGVVAER